MEEIQRFLQNVGAYCPCNFHPARAFALARVAAGLTVSELADALSLSKQYVSAVETRRRHPSVEMLRKLQSAAEKRTVESQDAKWVKFVLDLAALLQVKHLGDSGFPDDPRDAKWWYEREEYRLEIVSTILKVLGELFSQAHAVEATITSLFEGTNALFRHVFSFMLSLSNYVPEEFSIIPKTLSTGTAKPAMVATTNPVIAFVAGKLAPENFLKAVRQNAKVAEIVAAVDAQEATDVFSLAFFFFDELGVTYETRRLRRKMVAYNSKVEVHYLDPMEFAFIETAARTEYIRRYMEEKRKAEEEGREAPKIEDFVRFRGEWLVLPPKDESLQRKRRRRIPRTRNKKPEAEVVSRKSRGPGA